jgi:hypothetical protein
MTDARAAVGMDRLPWLADEPKPRPNGGGRDMLGWALAGAVVIAAGSYWLGIQNGRSDGDAPMSVPTAREPAATVKLPEPRVDAPQVAIAPPPEVRPAPMPTVSLPEPRVQKPVRRQSAPAKRRKLSPTEPRNSALAETVRKQTPPRKAAPAPAQAVRATAARAQTLTLWPARESRGAYGRVVRIGAFGSRQQAKLGWRRMQRAYPAVGRLPAVVVADRNSRGRVFYRFQIGTTSQAHSEVLCQRMRTIRYSCAVVGLPWKAKVER